MNDIVKAKQEGAYETYEKLLLERDALKKEAGSYMTSYLSLFGDQITRVFEEKIHCIAQKKSIAYCQAAANRGEQITAEKLKQFIDTAMTDYNRQFDQMVEDCQKAKAAGISSEYDRIQSKTVYRRIARLIHPDINPAIWKYPEITDLWNRTTAAYGLSDTDELQALELLIHRFLDAHGTATGQVTIDKIDDRIQTLEKEIQKIMSTDPYTYRDLLNSPEAIAEKRTSLDEELAEYQKYARELEKIMADYRRKGVITEWLVN